MLHRFEDRTLGMPGHDPAKLRQHLGWLRRQKHHFVSVNELVRLLVENPRALRRTLCLVVDDGYEDFARIGSPVFAEFDCPITVFLTSDFIDGKMWFWWDRIEYALSRSTRRECKVDLANGSQHRVSWSDAESRKAATESLVETLKRVSDEDRLAALGQIRDQMGVDIPANPPVEYAPMRWEQVRGLESAGVTFGAHSVTHPILSRTTAEQSAIEIHASWDRVRAETSAAVPVFCYPNGRPQDFSRREIQTVRQAGLVAALAAHEGYASARDVSVNGSLALYALPRFPWPERREHLVQIVSGLERAKALSRGYRRALPLRSSTVAKTAEAVASS